MVTKFLKRKGWEGEFLYKNNWGREMRNILNGFIESCLFLKKRLIGADSVASHSLFAELLF